MAHKEKRFNVSVAGEEALSRFAAKVGLDDAVEVVELYRLNSCLTCSNPYCDVAVGFSENFDNEHSLLSTDITVKCNADRCPEPKTVPNLASVIQNIANESLV